MGPQRLCHPINLIMDAIGGPTVVKMKDQTVYIQQEPTDCFEVVVPLSCDLWHFEIYKNVAGQETMQDAETARRGCRLLEAPPNVEMQSMQARSQVGEAALHFLT